MTDLKSMELRRKLELVTLRRMILEEKKRILELEKELEDLE